MHCNYISAYSGFNIHLNVSALLLEIMGHFDARYTANLVPNTAHIQQFTPSKLWSRPYTRYLQLRIYMLQYSAVGICAAIVHNHINSMRVILQTLCEIQRTSSSLRYVNCGPGHIQCIYSTAYSGFNVQLNGSALQLEISRQC
jgi:uncharacterized integral membrane protein